ncbi:MAG: pseudouridine synthase [Lachnospiraceae bacterium]|mgnify:CR=1 FL=1|jgi:23S rRNA pseudouridine2604 synthase|nr:pseudouridine synthase [Lachnospiraceae bacterium]
MEEKKEIRLNKYLSDAGICSRREADKLIERGQVFVDGELAFVGMKVLAGQNILVNGKKVQKEEEFILLAVNKPVGVVCTTTTKFKEKTIVQLVRYPKRIYPIGRLDKSSQGLILMTNQGEIADKILRGSNYHEKEYSVTVDREIIPDFLEQMRNGVPILNTITRKCEVKQTGKKSFSIILTQGLNRQIRRMCEYCGYRVVKLKRVRIMNILLGDLKEGEYRDVTEEERKELLRLIKD